MTVPTATHGQWISIHVFYAGNADEMLVECVAPLVARLRNRGLIQRYFFIRYWLEGPHVRLRLLPSAHGDAGAVRAEASSAVDAFLRRRPAPPRVDDEHTHTVYKRLYLAEYGQPRWDACYGPDGSMPLRPNNSYHFTEYEPEFDRYGGPDGLA